MEVKNFLTRTYRREHFWLCVIVLATLVMHFALIARPPDIIFDEQHYIEDARNIISNHETLRPEHPPLGKLFLVAGMEIFGDNPVGWRFFPIIFGTAIIVFFYFTCRGLGMGRTGSSLATFLLAFENMNFVQSHLTMLDVYFLVFMMASFMFYVNRQWVASGAAIGLSALAKLNGALALPTVAIHWIFSRAKRSKWFLLTVIMAPVTFVGWMTLLDLAIVQRVSVLKDPISRTLEMLSLSGMLKFSTTEHEALSRPWSWLISYKPVAYWLDPHYTGAISFTIWALAIPVFAYMLWRAIRGSSAGLFGVAWFFSNYIMWIVASVTTDRVSYIYYFYPVVGSICLGLGMALAELIGIFRKRHSGKLKWTVLSIVILLLLAHLASFIILAPVVPVDWGQLLHVNFSF